MSTRGCLAASIVALAVALPAAAQKGESSSGIAGAWKLVTVTQTNPDGSKVEVFGNAPLGGVLFTPDGHFSVVFMKGDLPKFKSGIRYQGTPEENTAVVQGSLAYTGRYTIDGDALTMVVDASTFPAWTGQTQKRKFTVKNDTLEWVGITGVQGAGIAVKLKRP